MAILGLGASSALALTQAPLEQRQSTFLGDWLPRYFDALEQPAEKSIPTMLEGLLFLSLPQCRGTQNGYLWLRELQEEITATPGYADVLKDLIQSGPSKFGLRTPVTDPLPNDHVLVLHAAGFLPTPDTVRLLGNILDDMRPLPLGDPPCDLVPPAFLAACALSRLNIEGAPDSDNPYFLRIDARDVLMGESEYEHIERWKQWWQVHEDDAGEIQFRRSRAIPAWSGHSPVLSVSARKILHAEWKAYRLELQSRRVAQGEAAAKARNDLARLNTSDEGSTKRVTSLPASILAIIGGCIVLACGTFWLGKRRTL